MKRVWIFLGSCLLGGMMAGSLYAETTGPSKPAADSLRWFDPQQAGFPVVEGQAWPQELAGSYGRWPERLRSEIRDGVWKLSCQSAGLSVRFRSNASPIRVRYRLTRDQQRAMDHMPATGVSGLDLYALNRHGEEIHVKRRIDWSKADTIYYEFQPQPDDRFAAAGYEFQLYLPLYNGVSQLEIGVDTAANFTFLPLRTEKPIVAYGTSILQGACASRPGMAWSTMLSRRLDLPLLNFGFSGSGVLDSAILAELGTIDARLYILDCLPNLVEMPDSVVTARFRQGVALLRRHHQAPILLIEHAEAPLDGVDSAALHKNRVLRACYEQLCEEGVPELYYLSCEEIALPADALVDGIHPTDYGMVQQAKACEAKIREILNVPLGTISTTCPVRQRRDAPYYEWTNRHEEILAHNRIDAPTHVILGNSIVHFWDGEGGRYDIHGGSNWPRIMAPVGFRNMGCGHDRIENVLWRVYHGELDGYTAQRVVLMIGTNNLSINTDEEIVEGMAHLVKAVRDRQPQAQVEVIGVLPRRDLEDRVATLNGRLAQKMQSMEVVFRNPGIRLLKKNHRIDDALFLDGVHLTEQGYDRIASEIATGVQ